MGNFFEVVPKPPEKGKVYTITDTRFTLQEKYPQNIFGQGTKVKVIGSKYLVASNPNAPKVMVTIVQLPNGKIDVYPSSNIK